MQQRLLFTPSHADVQKSSNICRTARKTAAIYTSFQSTICPWEHMTPIMGLLGEAWMKAQLTAGEGIWIPAVMQGRT